jgi:anti-sigma regulatory factor (Ser/Thr protein kinase)
MERLELELTANPSEAKRLRNELHQWLLRGGINGTTGHDIILAAVEAFANAVKHPIGRATPWINIEGELQPDAVTLTIEDDGHWRQPDPTRDSGGFGLALMKSFMTNVHIERTHDRTRVVLHRLLAG